MIFCLRQSDIELYKLSDIAPLRVAVNSYMERKAWEKACGKRESLHLQRIIPCYYHT